MERPFVNDIENFMTEFVNSVEGETVMSIVGPSPDFDNADYYFKKENVLIELKCFEKDPFSKGDGDKTVRFMTKWLEKGFIKVEDLFSYTSGNRSLPEECIQDMIQSCRKTFEEAIRKGNRQLRETKNRIGNDKTLKVLLLCNDGNYFLNEAGTFAIINDIFASRKDLEVDCFVLYTINQVSRMPNDDIDWMLWYPSYHISSPDELCAFINWLGVEFNTFYNTKFGITNAASMDHKDRESAEKTLKSQSYIPKSIIYKDRK